MPVTPSEISAPLHRALPRVAAPADAPLTTTTFLFTDIEGSTRQWERLPDMHDRVERHFDVLRRHVGEFGGVVFSTMGDGIAASFPSAEAALHAAIGAQLELPRLDLSVRMGLHTGEAQRAGPDFRGRTLNRAAADHGHRPRRPDPAVERDRGDRDHRAEPGGPPRSRDARSPGLR